MVYRICINAGHGLKNDGSLDPGAIGVTGYKEYIETKELVDLVNVELQFNGVKTLVIQDGDLWDVTNQSNTWKADYFVSIHCNAFSADSHGVETFSLATTGQGRILAQSIHKELVPATGLFDRGLKTANYHVLKYTNCPAVLTEVGFISNAKEEALMKDPVWDSKVATAIAKGICNFLKIEYKIKPLPAPTPIPIPSTEIYRIKINSIQLSAWSNKDTALSIAQTEYDKSPIGSKITIEQKSDGVIIYDQTKPKPVVIQPTIDYETELFRIKIGDIKIIVLTGLQKCINYANQNLQGKSVNLECVKDGKIFDLGVIPVVVVVDPIAEVKIEPVVIPETTPTPSPLPPKHLVMGTSEASVNQAETYLHKINPLAPFYAQIYKEEAEIEGVRWDISFAQAIKESNYFRFGGDALPEWNNFSGIGVTGAKYISETATDTRFVEGVIQIKNAEGKDVGVKFATPRLGIRCQIQHLKAYSSLDNLVGILIDPRFKYVQRNKAIYIEDYGSGVWASDTNNYGGKIWDIVELMKNTVVEEIVIPVVEVVPEVPEIIVVPEVPVVEPTPIQPSESGAVSLLRKILQLIIEFFIGGRNK